MRFGAADERRAAALVGADPGCRRREAAAALAQHQPRAQLHRLRLVRPRLSFSRVAAAACGALTCALFALCRGADLQELQPTVAAGSRATQHAAGCDAPTAADVERRGGAAVQPSALRQRQDPRRALCVGHRRYGLPRQHASQPASCRLPPGADGAPIGSEQHCETGRRGRLQRATDLRRHGRSPGQAGLAPWEQKKCKIDLYLYTGGGGGGGARVACRTFAPPSNTLKTASACARAEPGRIARSPPSPNRPLMSSDAGCR
jgi:hypothetical protein